MAVHTAGPSTTGSTALVGAQQLSFTRTMDRTLVHRAAVHEVFVTDLIDTGPDEFAVGAQLPRAHACFLDSANRADRAASYDLLLIAECGRQAATCLAHARYGVPADQVFLATSGVVELHGGPRPVGDRPAELVMAVHTRPERRGGATRALHHTIDYLIDGELVARSAGSGRYVAPETYLSFRADRRTGPPTWSTSLVRRGIPVAPAAVGRSDPHNVLLADADRAGPAVTARVDVSGAHGSLFDHPLDHYPAMLLADAAVQAALLAAPGGQRAWWVVRMVPGFGRLAELDVDLLVRAEVVTTAPDRCVLEVGFTQGGTGVAEVRITLARRGRTLT